MRSRQGLAYSVYAAWSPRYDYPGLFLAGGQTRSTTAVPFIQGIRAEIDKIRQTPIGAQELTLAKDSVLNSFVFNFQEPSQTLSRLLWYEHYHYPSDFIFRYQQGIKAVTVADIQRVAQTYLQPEELVTLVVGNASAMEPPLSTIAPDGAVTAIDIRILEPLADPASSTPRE
nr:insulinase family protein [Neosynechococcus sphagnicola]